MSEKGNGVMPISGYVGPKTNWRTNPKGWGLFLVKFLVIKNNIREVFDTVKLKTFHEDFNVCCGDVHFFKIIDRGIMNNALDANHEDHRWSCV